jgi:hypothetical protein
VNAPAPQAGPGGGSPKLAARWDLGAGVVAWLASVLGPAISFDVAFSPDDNISPEFHALFGVLTAVLFLLTWKRLGRLPIWALAALALVGVLCFAGYAKTKRDWSCAYFPNINKSRVILGTQETAFARAKLAELQITEPGCEARLRPFGGKAETLYEGDGLYWRFVMLFGFYALTWLSLALLVLGAVRRAMKTEMQT